MRVPSIDVPVPAVAWPLLRAGIRCHVLAYRATGGLVGHRVPGVPPVLLLDTIGARTGDRRTTPLVYLSDGEDLVIVASKGGHRRNPAWFHNLLAHPLTEVQVGSRRRPVRARIATPAERARLWPLAVAVWPGYRDYQARTEREIPLVVLEPRGKRPRGSRPRRS